MTLTIERFSEFFEAAYQRQPFPWQERLAHQVFESGWPSCIDLPTASGKTACIDVAVFVLACQANRQPLERTVGRRVFFTVNRRVIVDEAFSRAQSLAQKLVDAEANESGILSEVARALRGLNEESDPSVAPPLAIAQVRGGVFRDADWARSLTQPMVICTTADQLGSRMLFRGYGVSDNALPIHAALCTHDATILLDEAHVTKAFCETLGLLQRYQQVRQQADTIAPAFRFVQMTATPQGSITAPFRLNDDDFHNPILRARQVASKPAELILLAKRESIEERIAQDALRLGSESPRAVGIIVNRVPLAREIARRIQSNLQKANLSDSSVHLVIGRMRPWDRDRMQEEFRDLVGPSRPTQLAKTVFVVATQCLEVGADYDFDVMLTQCASIDALRQRFGRLNRAGRTTSGGEPIETISAIYMQESADRDEDPIYGLAIKKTWEWLQSVEDSNRRVDFGISAFQERWDSVSSEDREAMLAPAPHAAILLPAHLDLLCQTSPRPVPEPEVSTFIHGVQRTNADVNVCWRADLGDDDRLWPDIVRLLPPTSLECMSVPIWTFRQWLLGKPIDTRRDADTIVTEAEPDDRNQKEKLEPRKVLRWRGTGNETIVVSDAEQIRPGDTLVLRVEDGGWGTFGHIPSFGQSPDTDQGTDQSQLSDQLSHIDIAESCCRAKNLRHVIRLHPAFPNRSALRSLPTAELRAALMQLASNELANGGNSSLLESVRDVLAGPLDRHTYPTFDELSESLEAVTNEVIICRRLLPRPLSLELPTPDSDDEEDDRSQSVASIRLEEHTKHVVDKTIKVSRCLQLRVSGPLEYAARWHDLGKADVRFQALLSRLSPEEAIERRIQLAKSDGRHLTTAEREQIRERSGLPRGFRHELLSSQLVESASLLEQIENANDRQLVLRLIEAHHGFARPFAPVIVNGSISGSNGHAGQLAKNLLQVELDSSSYWPEIEVSADQREQWPSPHRVDSGFPQRFWFFTRLMGWWGLAFVESVLRLADQRASAEEEMERS